MRIQWNLLLIIAGFLAVCLWPVANFLNVNFPQISIGAYGPLDDIAFVLFVSFAIGIVTALVAFKTGKQWMFRSISAATVFIFVLFISKSLQDLAVAIFNSTEKTAAAIAIGVIVALTSAVWWLSKLEPVRTLVALGAIIALVLPVVSLAPQWSKMKSSNELRYSNVQAKVNDKRTLNGNDIYFIVMDGYTRDDTMLANGFDNSQFMKQLEDRRFVIDESAYSNYTSTHVSFMAMLEANYVVNEKSPRYSDREQFYPTALNNGRVPDMVRTFAASGYKTIRLSNSWGRCEAAVFDHCYFEGGQEMSYPMSSLLAATVIHRFLEKKIDEAFVPGDDAVDIFSQRFFEITRQKPLFLFAHSLAPHAPFKYNADCSSRTWAWGEDNSPDIARPLYLGMVQCINSKLIKLVDRIIKSDPDSIIVLTADHGSDFRVNWQQKLEDWSLEAQKERTSILSATRLPKGCKFKSGMGQINLMRSVLGCVEGKEADLLPERSYLTVYENSSEFGRVHLVDSSARDSAHLSQLGAPSSLTTH